jgi:Fur family ferric uptake transcriptional regulator
MGCESDTATILREAGARLTPQRMLIVSAVRHANGHIGASTILEQVRTHYPYVDLSTVYRTLAVLKNMHLITETDMGTGDYSYEWIHHNRHHHLICKVCGSVTLLDHDYLENVGTEIFADYSFRADLDHFAIFGMCADCQQKNGESH